MNLDISMADEKETTKRLWEELKRQDHLIKKISKDRDDFENKMKFLNEENIKLKKLLRIYEDNIRSSESRTINKVNNIERTMRKMDDLLQKIATKVHER